jgi:hypothetical protein
MSEHDAERRILGEMERVYKNYGANRLELGKLAIQLQNLYSERNCGGGRRSSGHGEFERELKARGFSPRRIRECIADYEVSIGVRPATESTSAKREARRVRATQKPEPLIAFVALLPFEAAQAVYHTAVKVIGANERSRRRELDLAWERVLEFYGKVVTLDGAAMVDFNAKNEGLARVH